MDDDKDLDMDMGGDEGDDGDDMVDGDDGDDE